MPNLCSGSGRTVLYGSRFKCSTYGFTGNVVGGKIPDHDRTIGSIVDSRPILVGEANPYGGDPRFALYPEPERSAGGRLCRLILRLDVRDYLRRYDRRNLCPEKWSMKVARPNAIEISKQAAPEGRVVVVFGSKVAEAFYEAFVPFSITVRPFAGFGSFRIVTLPHPSGRCRAWNTPGAYERAREVLAKAGVV